MRHDADARPGIARVRDHVDAGFLRCFGDGGDARADAAGNASLAGSSSWTVDMTAPSAPVINSWSDDTGAAGDGIHADRAITLGDKELPGRGDDGGALR